MKAVIAIVVAATFAPQLRADTLTLAEVLASSERHFPAIQAAVSETLIRRGKTVTALGAFDLAMEQEGLGWTSGFYDGLSLDSKLVKRIPDYAAKISGGYRIANDDFPVYQDELVTNSGGEFNLGVVFSLWRDRDIDSRRFNVYSARLGERDAEIELMVARLLTQRNAARAYWNWVAAGQRLGVFERLAGLAEDRMSGLKRRAAAGDVAEIFVIENQQNLLRRQALLTNARRDFRAAAISLSLYLRDRTGMPLEPDPAELPESFPPAVDDLPELDAMIATAIGARPELAKLEVDRQLEGERLKLARNALKPRVDLGLKAANDLGRGSASRQGFDTIVDLTVSIPLQRRLGRGQVTEAEARIEQIDFERRLAEDRIANEVLKLANAIEAAVETVGITENEAEQALVLERAERKRFRAGASDFFVVNLREERSADALIRNLDAKLEYFRNLTDFQATTVNLKALGLSGP